ncbi:siroheme synthase [Anaerococcus sp. AGMB00486]|uniref:precorrin-2 dehydrogenase n=2 Tax=Anaerococcus TaxID=165779 RepID=A0ABX2NCR2_9FIRM|nr:MULTISPECIES: NAD(P)-dependent oxidoreductase [Anaerococcus]MDY3005538.1 NAD(P)-dependent oxidoreductase [Anaerococcus porci]MSS78616.1 siroheme synthase [Anaerococcus porci]NVF12484.1 siroheme synthase [Anaerococcus faecalis]
MRYFPISIDSKDKICLFLGAGKIAFRKIRSLLKGNFDFLVFAKDINENIKLLSETYPERFVINIGEFDENFIFPSCDFVFLASGDEVLNKKLFKKAQDRNLWVLDLTNSSDSDFYLRNNIKKDFIDISISTNGKLPFLSKMIGDDIKKYLDGLDMEKISLIINIRDKLKVKGVNSRGFLQDLYRKDRKFLDKYLESLDE